MVLQNPDPTATTGAFHLVVALVANLVVLVYVWRAVGEEDTGTQAWLARPSSDEAESVHQAKRSTVQCPDCDAPNDPGYKYCRECVTELPGHVEYVGRRSPPVGRFIQ